MGWGKIDDAFDEHPKVLALLDGEDLPEACAAITLWTLCFTWAHRRTRRKGQTPGLLPAGLPRRQLGPSGRDAAKTLVKYGLWDEVPDGGWQIHDFADYLPDAETRAARAEAGRRGAAARWGARAPVDDETQTDDSLPNLNGKVPSENGKQPTASHEPDGKTDGNAVANDGSRGRARRGTPEPEPEPEPEPSSSAATRGGTKRGTRIPDDFQVTPAMVEWARTNVPEVDGRRETEKFINYWQAKPGKDGTKLDWVATWRNWMLNAADRSPSNGARASPGQHRTHRNDPNANYHEEL